MYVENQVKKFGNATYLQSAMDCMTADNETKCCMCLCICSPCSDQISRAGDEKEFIRNLLVYAVDWII